MEKKCCAPDCEHCPFPDCNVEMTKQEKWAAHQREYRRKHPGVDTPYHRRWIENHYEQYRQQQNKSQRRRYRDSFEVREKIKEKNRRYYQAHKEQMKEYQVNYRERRRSRVRIRMQKLSETVNAEQFIHLLPSVRPQEPKWIPVSERLPMEFEFVNCTCHSLIDDREDWVVETVYIPQPSDSPYSDWGNIPMLNSGDCEVVAWVHRDIPKPYRAESEDKE